MTAESSRFASPSLARMTGASLRITLLVCLLLVMAGGSLVLLILATQPEADREGAVRESAALVNVTRPEAGDFHPMIVATGSVRPAREITLRPRVSGQIAELSADFVPGGHVEAGEVLARLDDADYRNTLRQRESELAQARADLAIEKGRQDVAKRDYEQMEQELSEENAALVLREPQRRQAEAAIESAEAAVEQARLELERTRVATPFEAHVVSREVDAGSQVAPGDALGRLVGLDTYWVEATLPLSKLAYLDFPAGAGQGSPVTVHDRAAWPDGASREGRLFRLIGELNEQTRMARVLVAVDDPHGRRGESSDTPRLMIGSFVEARIRGRELEDVIRVNRDYIRERDTIWLMRDGQLVINELDIVFEDADHAYIRDGLRADDRVVTSSLATVEEGIDLRVEEAAEGDVPEEASQP